MILMDIGFSPVVYLFESDLLSGFSLMLTLSCHQTH
jgi:hypothetical protein